MHPLSPLIIKRPELQSRTQRTLNSLLRVIAWASWVYLWLPLLTLCLWMIGMTEFKVQVVNHARGTNLQLLPWLIISAACMVVAWSSYNRINYSGRNRRSAAPIVSQRHKAAGFGITEPFSLWQLSQDRVSFSFDEEGHIRRISSGFEDKPFLVKTPEKKTEEELETTAA